MRFGFEMLIQFIVPLTFLAIWALTSLLNRDAQPLPPRPGRLPGPRPGGPADRRLLPPEPPARPAAATRPPERPMPRGMPTSSPSSRARSALRQPLNMGEAIVYLENEPGSGGASRTAPVPAVTARPQMRGSQGRKSGRPRNAETGLGTSGRTEAQPQRALSDQMNQSMALQRTKPLELTPLNAPIAKLARPITQASATAQVAQDRGASPAASFSASEFRTLMATPGRLREIAVLSEILRPPVALRPRRHRK
jgi:hypothetical protein